MRPRIITEKNERQSELGLDKDLSATKNDKRACMLKSGQDYEFQQETKALLKLVRLSEHSLKSGVLELDKAFE